MIVKNKYVRDDKYYVIIEVEVTKEEWLVNKIGNPLIKESEVAYK